MSPRPWLKLPGSGCCLSLSPACFTPTCLQGSDSDSLAPAPVPPYNLPALLLIGSRVNSRASSSFIFVNWNSYLPAQSKPFEKGNSINSKIVTLKWCIKEIKNWVLRQKFDTFFLIL